VGGIIKGKNKGWRNLWSGENGSESRNLGEGALRWVRDESALEAIFAQDKTQRKKEHLRIHYDRVSLLKFNVIYKRGDTLFIDMSGLGEQKCKEGATHDKHIL